MKKAVKFIVAIVIVFSIGVFVIYHLAEKDKIKEITSENIFDENNIKTKEVVLDIKLPKKVINPKIIIYKSKRELDLYSNGKVVKKYKIGLGHNPLDDKAKKGDKCTPEGEFYICMKNRKSKYYLSLGISYPNIEDAKRGLKENLISNDQYQQIYKAIKNKENPPWNTKLGGEICIHGRGSSSDWTRGCIALNDDEIEEIFNKVNHGTTVIIKK